MLHQVQGGSERNGGMGPLSDAPEQLVGREPPMAEEEEELLLVVVVLLAPSVAAPLVLQVVEAPPVDHTQQRGGHIQDSGGTGTGSQQEA